MPMKFKEVNWKKMLRKHPHEELLAEAEVYTERALRNAKTRRRNNGKTSTLRNGKAA